MSKPSGTAVLDAGFFVDYPSFYRRLREMPTEELAEICMTSISFTNTLHQAPSVTTGAALRP
jgi:hypothetical protein